MNKKIREILERQSELISKQRTLICKLNEELQKRNLKTEEVALVLQGVTLGLKNARKGLFWLDLYVHIIWTIYLVYTCMKYAAKILCLLGKKSRFLNEFYSYFAYVF